MQLSDQGSMMESSRTVRHPWSAVGSTGAEGTPLSPGSNCQQKVQLSLQCLVRVEMRWAWRQGHRPCLNISHLNLVSVCNSTSRVQLVLLEIELWKNPWKTSDPVNCVLYLFCRHSPSMDKPHFLTPIVGYHGGSIYPCSGHYLHLIVNMGIRSINKSCSLSLNLILSVSLFPLSLS